MIPSGKNAERIISAEKLQGKIEFLCDTLFHEAGLMKMGGKWSRSFGVGDKAGHNIVGFMPGKRAGLKESYVLVTAHYDSDLTPDAGGIYRVDVTWLPEEAGDGTMIRSVAEVRCDGTEEPVYRLETESFRTGVGA